MNSTWEFNQCNVVFLRRWWIVRMSYDLLLKKSILIKPFRKIWYSDFFGWHYLRLYDDSPFLYRLNRLKLPICKLSGLKHTRNRYTNVLREWKQWIFTHFSQTNDDWWTIGWSTMSCCQYKELGYNRSTASKFNFVFIVEIVFLNVS